MDIIAIIEMLLSSHTLNHWTGSHGGFHTNGPRPVVSVVEGKVGVKNLTTFWAHVSFTEDGVKHELKGERPILGGDSTITLDGTLMSNAHLILAHHITGFPPKLKVEIDFMLEGNLGRYRFDAEVH